MTLDEAAAALVGKELDGVLSHWDFDRQAWPVSEDDRRGLLLRHIRNRKAVEQRLATMPSRLRELLVHIVRTNCCARPFDIRSLDVADLPLESYEILPVAMALAERGLLIMTRVRSGATRLQMFQMPEELSRILEGVLAGTRKPVDATLSLGSWLRFVGKSGYGPLLDALGRDEWRSLAETTLRERLVAGDDFAVRAKTIAIDELRELVNHLEDHGGIIDGEARRRLSIEADDETLPRWGQALEAALVGSFECSELANLGLACRKGWLVIFHEIADLRLAEMDSAVDQDDAEGAFNPTLEPLADLQGIVDALEESPLKLKKSGEYPKTG
ncbi:MAG: hypothetical protein KDB53_05785, partial [Planctomycetes bacterium]|nr:hypothetical protein [Planctomycetota bacterium]